MRTFDLAPLYRASVGFDQIADMMDRVLSSDVAQPTYPPYNIEKTSDDTYRISVAVAGFSDNDLSVEVKENALVVSARKADEDEQRTYLHRGIATRAFERRFQLADHVHVTGAVHEHGMLHIDLKREVPEALKPRQIEIANGSKAIEFDRELSRPARRAAVWVRACLARAFFVCIFALGIVASREAHAEDAPNVLVVSDQRNSGIASDATAARLHLPMSMPCRQGCSRQEQIGVIMFWLA